MGGSAALTGGALSAMLQGRNIQSSPERLRRAIVLWGSAIRTGGGAATGGTAAWSVMLQRGNISMDFKRLRRRG